MKRNRRSLILSLALLVLFQGALATVIHPLWVKNYCVKQKGIAKGLSPDQLLLALAGFREMIAGVLWVRADSFFDTGNYDAVLPIIRLVTWLNPKDIDVYATGMWHIAYNFTDEDQRSDRRYIPSALALGRQGAENNPDTYELFFENGWLWHHKIEDDFPRAAKWWEKALEYPDMINARKNLLSVAYQRNGEPDKALEHYYKMFDLAIKAYEKDKLDSTSFQNKETIQSNIDTLLVRMAQRGHFGKKNGLKSPIPYDTEPPFDVGFSVKATVVEPKVIHFTGTWNVLPVGTRIRVIFRDEDYPNAIPGGMIWDTGQQDVELDPPKDLTFLQDGLFVRDRRFNKTIDMSKDPTMYSFQKDKYVLEFYYNPRTAPPHIQDKFGWNGEGMTDQNYLNTEIRPGQRLIYTRMELTKDQILRRGEWVDKTPVLMTKNYKSLDKSQFESEVIKIPSLLAEPQKK